MSLTSYQAAPPCNKGRSNVPLAPGRVNEFCYRRRTLTSAFPALEPSRASVTA
jgi:hypothetical protein